MRYCGAKGSDIYVVSDKPFTHDSLKIFEVPDELNSIPSSKMMVDCKIRNEKVVLRKTFRPAKELKVALVGNWKMQCGIATYSGFLWPEVTKQVGSFRLFIEESEQYIDNINRVGDETVTIDNVTACWKRGESPAKLIQAIKDYDPDIVWIQHEFGLWPNARYWLSMMSQLNNYRIIVTMHSVFHHKDKTIVEAAIPEIVVHLEGAEKVLKEEKQIPGKVYVIPHGCFPCTNKERLWNFYKSEHTIIQAGFLFRYKGWQEALKAVHILKKKYSDVFFTGLCSENEHNRVEHQIYYNELTELISELDIKENVALIRGYQSEQTWDSYFRTNKVAVFPYVSEPEHEVFGASGAARIAMEKYIPVITSCGNHFSDIPTIKAQSAEDMAQEIEKLFLDQKLVEDQLNKQIDYLEKNSWANVADKYLKIFENP